MKEYIAQKEWVYPIRPAVKLVIDTFEFAAQHLPKYNPISVSGYHIREAGATALQELAFTLRDGVEYVQKGIERGLNVDEFVPRISFFFNAHNDFFEEIAKYRAARVVWAKTMKERFGAKNPRSMQMRFHTQTAGVSLTVQQPLNNIARVAIQALAGVLGGTQSLHTDSYDEALALPTDQAALIALRTQQIIAEETGVVNTVDPLGGSYFVESLTQKMVDGCLDYFDKIDGFGGMIEAIEAGFPQREIQEAAYEYQKAVEHQDAIGHSHRHGTFGVGFADDDGDRRHRQLKHRGGALGNREAQPGFFVRQRWIGAVGVDEADERDLAMRLLSLYPLEAGLPPARPVRARGLAPGR